MSDWKSPCKIVMNSRQPSCEVEPPSPGFLCGMFIKQYGSDMSLPVDVVHVKRLLHQCSLVDTSAFRTAITS